MTLEEAAALQKFLQEASVAAGESSMAAIQSQTLDFLSKYCVVDLQHQRYFRRVFETFDSEKLGYLNIDQV